MRPFPKFKIRLAERGDSYVEMDGQRLPSVTYVKVESRADSLAKQVTLTFNTLEVDLEVEEVETPADDGP